MKKPKTKVFLVTVTRTYEWEVTVRAKNQEEARGIAHDMCEENFASYKEGDVTLSEVEDNGQQVDNE